MSVGPARRPSRDRGVKRDGLHRVFLFRPASSAGRAQLPVPSAKCSGRIGCEGISGPRLRTFSFFLLGPAANGFHNPQVEKPIMKPIILQVPNRDANSAKSIRPGQAMFSGLQNAPDSDRFTLLNSDAQEGCFASRGPCRRSPRRSVPFRPGRARWSPRRSPRKPDRLLAWGEVRHRMRPKPLPECECSGVSTHAEDDPLQSLSRTPFQTAGHIEQCSGSCFRPEVCSH